ncbi:hypothetical protein [Arenibaculum pallidiluteum]|uniref:hypothetical protein n=1 Tax=Arenibaculum pallidiluteum TaxID=2812559 RepID=UPI001A95655E|nr:hypothetical protein [Arenibaculum pallidiluteum]
MRPTFEVQVFKRDHWVIETRCTSEEEARKIARLVLAERRSDGVRVVREWPREDGTVVERELFTEFRDAADRITLGPIDDPPRPCETIDEFYGVDARLTVSRLFKGYIEHLVVTPTEMLHNHAELRRLADKDDLLPSAVSRVAALQAGQESRARRDEIHRIIDTMSERARKAAGERNLPLVSRHGWARTVQAAAELGAPEDRDFLALVALSTESTRVRSWPGKVEFFADILDREPELDGHPLALLDGALADTLGVNPVVQELLGSQPSLARALGSLADLGQGRLEAPPTGAGAATMRMNALFASRAMPASRHVMLDWMRRQLKGSAPLVRNDPQGERTAFRHLLERLLTDSGLLGGSGMAEALTLRYMRFLEQGGATGKRLAIDGVVASCADARQAALYLMALAGSEFGRDQAEHLEGVLTGLVSNPASHGRFTSTGATIKLNLERLTALYETAAGSPLEPQTRRRVADGIDAMIASYIVNQRVVERLDNPGDPLRHRAIRLMQMCTPGVLTSQRALTIVRERVIGHLRQPNFEQKFVADIADPAVRERALRDFFTLLSRAGFH